MYISNAFIPNFVLGQTAKFSVIDREGISTENQKHDIKLTYNCHNEWFVSYKYEPSSWTEEDRKEMLVDPVTCKRLNGQPGKTTKDYEQGTWGKLYVTLFSVLVSSSLLAAYSPSTFYATIVYVAGSAIRPIFLFGTWKGWIYECTTPDAVIKLVESCYMKRHEEDLVGEEESYRMLQEILRSPELFKAITGSSLKGSTDPALDKMSDKDKKKLEHLQKLEQKGFAVEELIANMTGKTGIKPGENIDLD